MLLMNFEGRKQSTKWDYYAATLLQAINCIANEQMKQDTIDFKSFSYLPTLVSFWCLYIGVRSPPKTNQEVRLCSLQHLRSQLFLVFHGLEGEKHPSSIVLGSSASSRYS